MACIKNIGCFPSCEAILFPYEALETGVHTIMFDWLGVRKAITVEATAGEKITIPNFFNESSDPVFSILQPSGDYLCWDVENEMLADCPDDCGEDCEFYKKFTAEIIDTGGAQSPSLPEQGLSDQVYNINSSQVIDNGNDTYTISVIGAVAGAMAWDENGNVYEYDGSVWTLKAKGQYPDGFGDPRDYGAVYDGVTDCAPAINQCIQENDVVKFMGSGTALCYDSIIVETDTYLKLDDSFTIRL